MAIINEYRLMRDFTSVNLLASNLKTVGGSRAMRAFDFEILVAWRIVRHVAHLRRIGRMNWIYVSLLTAHQEQQLDFSYRNAPKWSSIACIA